MHRIGAQKQIYDGQKRTPWLPVAVRSFVVILLVSVIAYKLIMTPFNLQFDFSALLSLLLAIFAVGLAALFYFKATETSNTFYDNTYKFSQDIGALLARIESGFGERLKHLDDSYTSMRDQLRNHPLQTTVAETKDEIKEEQKELQRKLEERDRMLDELATRAQMQDDEKKDFLNKLNEREKLLEEARHELHFLQRNLRRVQAQQSSHELEEIPERIQTYIRDRVLEEIGLENAADAPDSFLQRRFAKLKVKFPDEFLRHMREHNLLGDENELTERGFHIIRDLARTVIRFSLS